MFPRLLRLAVHAIAALNVISTTLSVFATPIPLPLPLMAADYSLSLVSVNRTTPRLGGQSLDTLPLRPEPGSLSTRSVDSLSSLHDYYNGAFKNSQNLRNLAAESENADNDDDDLHRQALSELTGFNENIQGFQTVFTEAMSDKGLAYYQKSEALETLLKNIIDANKDVLSATSTLVDNIPALGPILGPIIYQLKCFVDAILDIVEDLTDATIKQIVQPLLVALLGSATASLCQPGVDVLGLCL